MTGSKFYYERKLFNIGMKSEVFKQINKSETWCKNK